MTNPQNFIIHTTMTDLHTHSDFSDGTMTPEELAAAAARAGVGTLALTDHDTVAGLPRFQAACQREHIRPVLGLELSAEWSGGECHFTAYHGDFAAPHLQTFLRGLNLGRAERNRKIVARLARLGLDVSYDELLEVGGEEVIGRPHIAALLVKKGICATVSEAFDRYLGSSGPAFEERTKPEPLAAITLLKETGAVVAAAHPTLLNRDWPLMIEHLRRWRDSGLDGLEVYTHYVSVEQAAGLKDLCLTLGLKISGGSDFHGTRKPGHRLGRWGAGWPLRDEELTLLT